ncbi:hypothetical protein SAMD00019534_108030 [Acytostelium subglobosum LB1]|uniref:hypothetical protein n=1 Tax=Acytostelium subglobosum LB1 TaxID=1410327 RepID=UPI000644FA67|nr:hypothetical protein SAMD00019534_108030 [Acytostelium subglobosum LB1]GAM27627.1 hypothetical protein SAMD00019534_108030 [Acytostelium subglobosum LB1]|eukprot:XP_012749286.1 hypothetical protein SAMD00019534_108030 [Acytostelium subglobosum LB1]
MKLQLIFAIVLASVFCASALDQNEVIALQWISNQYSLNWSFGNDTVNCANAGVFCTDLQRIVVRNDSSVTFPSDFPTGLPWLFYVEVTGSSAIKTIYTKLFQGAISDLRIDITPVTTWSAAATITGNQIRNINLVTSGPLPSITTKNFPNLNTALFGFKGTKSYTLKLNFPALNALYVQSNGKVALDLTGTYKLYELNLFNDFTSIKPLNLVTLKVTGSITLDNNTSPTIVFPEIPWDSTKRYNQINGGLTTLPAVADFFWQNNNFVNLANNKISYIPEDYCHIPYRIVGFTDNVLLTSVPDCFLCQWHDVANNFRGTNVVAPPADYVCPISLDTNTYSIASNETTLTVYGTNIGWDTADIILADGTIIENVGDVVIPNRQFNFELPQPVPTDAFQLQFDTGVVSITVTVYQV